MSPNCAPIDTIERMGDDLRDDPALAQSILTEVASMFAPLIAKPQAKTAGRLSDKSALRRAQAYGHDRDIEQPLTSRRVPQTSPRFPGNELAAAWDFSEIPLYPQGRRDGPERQSPRPPIQAKLEVGAVNDPLEHEADSIADKVVRMAAPEIAPNSTPPQISWNAAGASLVLQRKCACGGTCSKCQWGEPDQGGEHVHGKPLGARDPEQTPAPRIVSDVLRSPGYPLDEAARAFMEPRFGRNFSDVRVHSGPDAASAANAIFARAFAYGRHIVFGTGHYRPDTAGGMQLLAHELAHVVQQSVRRPTLQRSPDRRWIYNETAARYRGKVMVDRIKRHGILSAEARAKINSELQYFEGSARDAYLQVVLPVLRAVVEIEMPEPNTAEISSTLAPAPKEKEKAQVCARLPEASSGKKCQFFVYDSTLPGALGTLWKVAAFGDAAARPATYVIPSGKNMEELLENILSTYADKDCDCTDEVQFWSHGSRGNGAWISGASGGRPEIVSADFDIPGLEKFGDDRQQPGYQEWESKLTTFQRRLMLLRRTICDSNSTVYYRSCQAFQGTPGREFAKASSNFWRCDVSGHTKSIGLSQPGKHTLSPCQEPDWPETEGADEESKKDKEKLREIKPK